MASRALTDVVDAVRCGDRELVRQEQERRVMLDRLERWHGSALSHRAEAENADPVANPGTREFYQLLAEIHSCGVFEHIRYLTVLDLAEQPDDTQAFVRLSRAALKR